MPVNYLTHEIYSINYEKLFNELMENLILDNVKLQSDYLKCWIEQLKQQDQIEVKQIKDKNFTQLMLKEDLEEPEKYMLELVYKSGRINIFFRVSRILQLIKLMPANKDMIQYLSKSDFLKASSYIKWNKTDCLNHVKSDPILLVPLTIDKYIKFVTIDGNHRLTAWENDIKKDIPCFILDGQWIIDNNMICSGFSKLMYIFQNEIVALGTYTKRDHINSISLINKIFFKTGKLLYNV